MPGRNGAAPPSPVVVPVVDHASVAVLMVDPGAGAVTYASPPALALTGDRAVLPCPVPAWSTAAGLGPLPGAQTWVDPVAHVAEGGTVSGWRVAFARPDGTVEPYWATGAQLLSGTGAGAPAMIAFFPVGPAPVPGTSTGASTSQPSHPAAEAAGVEAAAGDAAALLTDGALTARALLASSISFTISDPQRPDNPLIWVNPAFERTTGYAVDEVVGRNCRFLQGPDTDRAEVARIRAALTAGESVAGELLNYRADGTAFWNAVAISPVLDGGGRLTHFVGVQADVTARVLAGVEHDRLLAAERDARAAAEHARSRLALIERVGALLSETLDSEEALQRVVTAVVPALGDFCAVDVVEPAGPGGGAHDGGGDGGDPGTARVRRVAVAHRDPAKAPLYWRLAELDRAGRGASFVPRMLRTGRSLVVPPMDEAAYRHRSAGDEETYQVLRELDVHTGAVVPLRARGRVIAVLSVARTHADGRIFGSDDLVLAESLAARAALAVDNARLFEAEAAQRRRADALSAAGAALSASLRSADVVDVLLEQVVPAFCDWAFVHVDASGPASLRPPGVRSELHPVASRHADAQLESACAALLREWPADRDLPGPGSAWATGTAQLVPDVALALAGRPVPEGLREAVAALGVTSAISVPLTARGLTVGALTVCRHGGRRYSDEDLQFIGDLGRRGALALENARLYELQRVVALELQRSLLPDRLPSVPGLDVAGRYLAGAAGTEVGGEWYDVVQLADGRVTVAVGDVMGRGVRAAAVMGQLRSALRSYAVEGLSPAQVLDRLAAFTEVMEGEHLTTCLTGRFDPSTGLLELASAGHLPPLRLDADGRVELLAVDPGLPLGVPRVDRDGYRMTRVGLPPGDGLVLYTDGLVEDRDVPLGEGLERLESGMALVRLGSADEICDLALRVMGRLDSHDDDTAVLALRVPGDWPDAGPAGDRVHRLVLADVGPTAAALSRDVLREALAEAGLGALADVGSLLVSEVVTNALRHGGGPRELVVSVATAAVTVSVSDSSPAPPLERDQWTPSVEVLPENGRGLLLVAALADDWGWAQEPLGKRVWFRLRPRR